MIHQAFGTKSSTARAHMKLETRILDFLNGEEIGDAGAEGDEKIKEANNDGDKDDMFGNSNGTEGNTNGTNGNSNGTNGTSTAGTTPTNAGADNKIPDTDSGYATANSTMATPNNANSSANGNAMPTPSNAMQTPRGEESNKNANSDPSEWNPDGTRKLNLKQGKVKMYAKIGSCFLGAIHVCAFAHRSLWDLIGDVKTTTVRVDRSLWDLVGDVKTTMVTG